MKWAPRPVGFAVALALLCIAGVSACGRITADRREARDRHLRRALAAKEAQDIDRAIGFCERALERRPRLALAHRELALMLDNYRGDYARALYHYQRYLELRPDAPNREAVEQLIRHCRISFAAEIAESPDELHRDLQARSRRIAELELEVATLRERVAAPSPSPAVAAPRPTPAPAPPAAEPARTHVVQAGETLATISSRYYGTPARWKDIFNANRNKLSDANNLRVGTALVIPPN